MAVSPWRMADWEEDFGVHDVCSFGLEFGWEALRGGDASRLEGTTEGVENGSGGGAVFAVGC